MRLNAASSPADKPITIDLGPQYGSMAELKRDCCRKLAQRYNELEAKLFTGEGIELYGEDVFMLQDKDTLYLSPQGGPTPPSLARRSLRLGHNHEPVPDRPQNRLGRLRLSVPGPAP